MTSWHITQFCLSSILLFLSCEKAFQFIFFSTHLCQFVQVLLLLVLFHLSKFIPKFNFFEIKQHLYIHFHSVSFKFGVITMVSGIIGVPLGTYIAQTLKKRSKRADPIICACGLIISAPLLAGSMLVVEKNATIAYTLVFFGEVALNLNWAIVADILLVRKCVELR